MADRDSSWTAAMDRVGVFASAACFLHCLLTPVLLSFLSVYAHLLPSEERTHRALAVVVTLVGALAIVRGYRRHRRPLVMQLMGVGLTLIIGGAFCGDLLPAHWVEVMVTVAGSCCMSAAHRKNHTFCGTCVQCPEDGEHGVKI